MKNKYENPSIHTDIAAFSFRKGQIEQYRFWVLYNTFSWGMHPIKDLIPFVQEKLNWNQRKFIKVLHEGKGIWWRVSYRKKDGEQILIKSSRKWILKQNDIDEINGLIIVDKSVIQSNSLFKAYCFTSIYATIPLLTGKEFVQISRDKLSEMFGGITRATQRKYERFCFVNKEENRAFSELENVPESVNIRKGGKRKIKFVGRDESVVDGMLWQTPNSYSLSEVDGCPFIEARVSYRYSKTQMDNKKLYFKNYDELKRSRVLPKNFYVSSGYIKPPKEEKLGECTGKKPVSDSSKTFNCQRYISY